MIIQADALTLPLKPNSIDMIMTSPPYWSLRDYEVAGQIVAVRLVLAQG